MNKVVSVNVGLFYLALGERQPTKTEVTWVARRVFTWPRRANPLKKSELSVSANSKK
jgi:hypothetical protein